MSRAFIASSLTRLSLVLSAVCLFLFVFVPFLFTSEIRIFFKPPDFPWLRMPRGKFDERNYDIADAYIIALHTLKLHRCVCVSCVCVQRYVYVCACVC